MHHESSDKSVKILFFITSRMVVSNICTLITRRNKYLISRSNKEISPLLKSMILYAILSFYFTFLSQFIHLVLDIQASEFNKPLWTEKMQYVMRWWLTSLAFVHFFWRIFVYNFASVSGICLSFSGKKHENFSYL